MNIILLILANFLDFFLILFDKMFFDLCIKEFIETKPNKLVKNWIY